MKMKNKKIKDFAYQQYKGAHRISLFTIPILIIFTVIFTIIMIRQGVKDVKLYLGLGFAIIIGIISFFFSVYILKKTDNSYLFPHHDMKKLRSINLRNRFILF